MKISLLIPTTFDRSYFNDRLDSILDKQITGDVQVIIEIDNYEQTIGSKRNTLLQKAKGDYIAFIDSDDLVSENYISLLMEGIEKGVDCCSLKGIITEDGKNPKTFIHSIKYDSWFEKDGVYYRPPNHLSCIKASIAKQFKFPEINMGEDHKWSMAIQKSGLIKTEHWIDDVLYFYEYRSKK